VTLENSRVKEGYVGTEKEMKQKWEWLEFQPQEDIRVREATASEERMWLPETFPELISI
jgi:hypothetical protein